MNLALLLLFAVISLLFWRQVSDFRETKQAEDIEAMHDSMETSSASLLRSMALSANQAVAGYDFSLLNTLMQQVADGDKEIRYCLVMDEEGVVIAHNELHRVGRTPQGILDRQALALMAGGFDDVRQAPASIHFLNSPSGSSPDNTLMEAVTPVYNGRDLWGILRCGFSTYRLQEHIESHEREWDQQLSQIRAFYLSMVLVFILLGFLVAALITRRLLKAVDQLAGGVQKVSAGDLNHQLKMHDLFCAEFGSLAVAFNRMTSNLEASRMRLDEYNRSLEQKVEERTCELERSNKELEAFNYSVSHDLRAPLRSIDGFSQALIEDYQDRLDETGHDYLNRVRTATKQMGVLIDDMLRLSRLSRQAMSIGEVNLSELATQILTELWERDPDRLVECRIEPGLYARGDAHLLGVVLDNLIANAWKYTSRREQAKIEIGRTEQHGQPVFFVRDNGAGFDMKYADKLFSAFQRLHKSSEFEGTGIGLATVARILHRHGGSIWAESSVDKGAIFYFELPG